jgi:hypothetical protein
VAVSFLFDGPLTMRQWVRLRTLSQMASATVGSPRWSCQLEVGSWLMMTVDRVASLSSTTSRMSAFLVLEPGEPPVVEDEDIRPGSAPSQEPEGVPSRSLTRGLLSGEH